MWCPSVCIQMQIYLSPFNFQLFHLITYYLCVHMYCKLVFCVCPLYIPLTCNVCMFIVHVYTKLFCSTGVHKTSFQFTLQLYTNQFIVHLYTKPDQSTIFKFFVKGLSQGRKVSSSKIFFLTIFTNI